MWLVNYRMGLIGFMVAFFLFLFLASTATALYEEDAIKCKVCYFAIRHMWERGVDLRDHCKHPDNHTVSNEHCHLSNLQHAAILKLVDGTCEEMPTRYQHLHNDSGFHIFETDDPQHDSEVVSFIQTACRKWISDEHTIERIAELIFGNLDSGKDGVDILFPLSHKFCRRACNLPRLPPRKRKDPHHLSLHEGGSLHEYAYALQLEEYRRKQELEMGIKHDPNQPLEDGGHEGEF